MRNGGDNRAAFNEAYASLNAAQKQAVDSIEGPVMVVAGPGTGKTQILTLRIANILLQTDTPPSSVLALTFTESGAKAMRERLRRYIGTDAYKVPIYTFHGFAQSLISAYPDAYNRVIGGRPATDIEKISIIESIINGGEIKKLRPLGNPSYYVPHIIRIIGDLKQEYISPDDLNLIVNNEEKNLSGIEQYHTKGAHKGKQRGEYTKLEQSIIKNKELAYIYRSYEAALSADRLYDFEDMIVETVKALESNEEMLRDLQENYLYVLADEHQDVNGSQNRILELLSSFHDSPNIFAVGDEKQAIFRFQGASLENFLYFTEKFKGTKVISLTENYRSGQNILDAAHDLVMVEEGPLQELRIPLKALAVKNSSVNFRTFSHQAVEDEWLVEEVKNYIKNGTPAKEIAVIVRSNREVESFSALLRKSGLAVTASADSDILNHPITIAIRSLINATLLEKSEEALFIVLHGSYWNISHDDLVRVLSARSYNQSLYSIISNKDVLDSLGVKEPDKLLQVSGVLSAARKKNVCEAPHRVLEHLLQSSGFIDHVMTNDPIEGVRVVRRLYDEIEELVVHSRAATLRQVAETLETKLSYGLPLNAPFIADNADSVQVMTAHKSKGLEFNTVFIPHLIDQSWSGANKRKYFDITLAKHDGVGEQDFIEDERRLLYVAMTRAKNSLNLSYSKTNAEGKELIPARLLDDVPEQYLTIIPTTEVENKFNPVSSLKKEIAKLSVSNSFFHKILTARGLSATSLNNYLNNPWDYFYRNVLRIPEVQPNHMLYGTAVHNTLEYLTKYHTKEGKIPSDTNLKKKLETELGRLPLNNEEFSNLLDKGLSELLSYKIHLNKVLPKTTREEFKLQVAFPTGLSELPELALTGKLDRLDLDETGKVIRVIDYKTGKPKSRNVIEGKTKDSDGGYKRQLVFYALLLELYDDERYRCRDGVLSFVEPGASGQVREELFSITDKEISELKSLIISSVKEILSGEFLSKDCQNSDYCHLAELLKQN